MDEIAVPELQGDLATRIGQLAAFTEVWLANRRLSENTRAAYRVDVRDWLSWCRRNDVDPIAAKFTHVNAWARELENPAVGRPMVASTVARKMTAVSSWYSYLGKLGGVAINPAAIADRPRRDRGFTATQSFEAADATRMVEAAETRMHKRLGVCGPVLMDWFVQMGTRTTETCALNVGHLGHARGYRTVEIAVKGGKRIRRTLPPPLADEVERYLASRFPGGVTEKHHDLPLFADVDGHRIDRFTVSRFIRRLAKDAGVPAAGKISAHSARHAFATISREGGASLEERQRAMGHSDPRTTQGYDHTAMLPEQDPSLLVARAIARPKPAQQPGPDPTPPAAATG